MADKFNKKGVLSQGEPCDAGVNFDTYRIFNGIVRFLWHSTIFDSASAACYAERCLSYDRFCLTVRLTVRPSDRLSDRPSQSGIMPKRLQL